MRSYEILELLREAVELPDGCDPAARAFVKMCEIEPLVDACGLNAFCYFAEAKASLFQALQDHAEGEPWNSAEWEGFDFVPTDPASLTATAWGYFELYSRDIQAKNDRDN